MDYVFPDWAVAILKAPSERTQMESSLVGISVIMIGSLALILYMIFSGVVEGFWLIFLMSISEFGILSFQFSLLSTTYQTYRQYKMEMGFYPEDYKIKLLIEQAKRLKEDLSLTISKLEMKGDNKDGR